jgi:hypothetical protein
MVLRPEGTPEYRRSCVEAEGPPLLNSVWRIRDGHLQIFRVIVS